MRQTILAAAAAFIIGGIATGAVLTQAQPAPPAESMDGGPPRGPSDGGPPRGHHWMGWAEHRHPGPMGQGWRDQHGVMRTFALIYPQKDRDLSPADVQKIGEGLLLFRGNHTWKVTDVAPTSEGAIGFSLSTPEGSVVAKFTMDPHTGEVHRAG